MFVMVLLASFVYVYLGWLFIVVCWLDVGVVNCVVSVWVCVLFI